MFTGVEEKAVLATNGIESLRTAKVDLKMDGISHTMLVFVIPFFLKLAFFFCTCHNFFPLSSVQVIIIPACCLLSVL